MKVNKTKLKECAKRMLGFFICQDIFSFGEFERLINTRYCLGKELIEISYQSSRGNTLALDISYIVKGSGTIIDVKINPELGYTTFIVKTDAMVIGYEAFISYSDGNIAQAKTINFIEMSIIKGELEKLLEL